ncbi:MAG: SH3 domain-containing protein, partial [Clostridia bacterium]|nr:SH3 domain-containing protein [Clostridia bacterium]
VYCNGSNVNIRTGPSTSYEIITTISKDTKMTRINKGKQSGDKWDKVKLDNGIIGYIYQKYVTISPVVKIEKIDISIDNTTLQKGEKKQLKVTVFPQEASDHKLIYSSSNTKVATVDDKGNIQAISSGKATITVKAQENNVENKIDITVYSKVTEISLDTNEIYVPVGDIMQLNAYVKPDDANNKKLIYSIEDSSIANIEQDGEITAKTQGSTIINVTSDENSNIKVECKLFVVRKMDESEVIFDSSIKLDGLNISGIDYKNNTVLYIKNKISTDLDIEVVNNKNQILKDEDLIGTGSKIRLKEDGKILREYTIILYGDANGDGKINSIDLLVLQRHILEIELLQNIYKEAANIRKTANKPTSIDLLLIQRHILELQIIQQ